MTRETENKITAIRRQIQDAKRYGDLDWAADLEDELQNLEFKGRREDGLEK